jgi:hypothetical protein
MVLFAQFRRELKSSCHVEKIMAHRKQIQISKSKQAIQSSTSGSNVDNRGEKEPVEELSAAKKNQKEKGHKKESLSHCLRHHIR